MQTIAIHCKYHTQLGLCWGGTTLRRAKMAEPIEMTFGDDTCWPKGPWIS